MKNDVFVTCRIPCFIFFKNTGEECHANVRETTEDTKIRLFFIFFLDLSLEWQRSREECRGILGFDGFTDQFPLRKKIKKEEE